MTKVLLQYCGVYADGDAGDFIEWEAEIDGADEAAYLHAREQGLDLNDYEDLEAFLAAQREEIEAVETENGTFDPDEMDILVQFAED
jgi:hypothetical protein